MQISIPEMAITIFIVITITVTATWSLKTEQIKVLKQKNKVFEEQFSAHDLSKTFFLQKEVEKLAELTEGLRIEIANKDEKIKDLESNLKDTFSYHERFSLEEGKLKKIFRSSHIFSLTHIYEGAVTAIFDNKVYSAIKVGEYIKFEQEKSICRLLVEEINPFKRGIFRVLCNKKT